MLRVALHGVGRRAERAVRIHAGAAAQRHGNTVRRALELAHVRRIGIGRACADAGQRAGIAVLVGKVHRRAVRVLAHRQAGTRRRLLHQAHRAGVHLVGQAGDAAFDRGDAAIEVGDIALDRGDAAIEVGDAGGVGAHLLVGRVKLRTVHRLGAGGAQLAGGHVAQRHRRGGRGAAQRHAGVRGVVVGERIRHRALQAADRALQAGHVALCGGQAAIERVQRGAHVVLRAALHVVGRRAEQGEIPGDGRAAAQRGGDVRRHGIGRAFELPQGNRIVVVRAALDVGQRAVAAVLVGEVHRRAVDVLAHRQAGARRRLLHQAHRTGVHLVGQAGDVALDRGDAAAQAGDVAAVDGRLLSHGGDAAIEVGDAGGVGAHLLVGRVQLRTVHRIGAGRAQVAGCDAEDLVRAAGHARAAEQAEPAMDIGGRAAADAIAVDFQTAADEKAVLVGNEVQERILAGRRGRARAEGLRAGAVRIHARCRRLVGKRRTGAVLRVIEQRDDIVVREGGGRRGHAQAEHCRAARQPAGYAALGLAPGFRQFGRYHPLACGHVPDDSIDGVHDNFS